MAVVVGDNGDLWPGNLAIFGILSVAFVLVLMARLLESPLVITMAV